MPHKKYHSLFISSEDNTSVFVERVRQDYLKSCKALSLKLTPENSDRLTQLNRQYKFAKLIDGNQLSEHRGTLLWILESEAHWSEFIENVKPEDRIPNVLQILADLRQSLTPKKVRYSRKKHTDFFNLALAIALVWDKPRPKIHGQMGRRTLPSTTQPIELYEYFSVLYDSSKRKVRYKDLTVKDLIFVVNTPVPVSELQWALKNVRGSGKSWGKKYASISYDTPRLTANEYSWPKYNGSYCLENIEEHGGICVDQAYFAVMTGRACGIPTMYFSGNGKSGGHAWMGLFVDENEWVTDVGKYASNNYAVGHTKNPQTDKKISNHELEFSCNKKFRKIVYVKSAPFSVASQFLLNEQEDKLAYAYSALVIKSAALIVGAWDVKESILFSRKSNEGLKAFFIKKLKVFRDYPDILVEAETTYAKFLSDLGDTKLADKIYKKSYDKRDKSRTDLAQTTALARSKSLEKNKNYEDAAEVLEDFIYDNRQEHAQVFLVMSYYIDFCKRYKMEKDGCRFIKKCYYKLKNEVDALVILQLMDLMERAYTNAGEERYAARIRKDVDKIIEKKQEQAARDKKRDKRRRDVDDDDYD